MMKTTTHGLNQLAALSRWAGVLAEHAACDDAEERIRILDRLPGCDASTCAHAILGDLPCAVIGADGEVAAIGSPALAWTAVLLYASSAKAAAVLHLPPCGGLS